MSPVKKALAVLFLAAAVAPSPALGQQPFGVITTLEGDATVARMPASSPIALKVGDHISFGNAITTGQQALVKTLLAGKATLTIYQLTTLTMTEVPGAASINLSRGKIALSMLGPGMRPDATWLIRTPTGIIRVRGGGVIDVIVEAVGWVVDVDCVAGAVVAGAARGTLLEIPPGQGITIDGNALGPLRSLRPTVQSGLGR